MAKGYPRDGKPPRAANMLVEDHLRPAAVKARSLPDRRSASKRFTTRFTTISGWSVLWSMIWVTSIWRPKFWNRWKIPSAQKCYPCGRYILLPVCPGRTLKIWWPGTELNRRRQPFQSVAILHIQQLAGCGRLRKSFQLRASQAYYGLRCGLPIRTLDRDQQGRGRDDHC